ncbi:sensor histidine kinase [Sporolactobacillus shoreae]|nr:HAMP domain-containing sensor histidine kinase [Sporolactobacillus shoreae]
MVFFVCGMIITILCFVIAALAFYLYRTKVQLMEASTIVDEIANGNMNRRLIVSKTSPVASLCYKINEIVIQTKNELFKHQQAERSYRQLATSLSHDIRTPLASLTGYLEAIQLGYVTGKEKEQYIEIALNKALDLKYYVDTLFEWLKLESGERIYHYENIDIHEYAREIVSEWIPQFEKNDICYDISVPENELFVSIDKTALKRILDNLLQNVLTHGHATFIKVSEEENDNKMAFEIQDNGVGISETDLPHIFERLYKCNTARGTKGSGLGLSIVAELVKGLHGEITVKSIKEKGTLFFLLFPLLVPEKQD